jgi:hypothetical protein
MPRPPTPPGPPTSSSSKPDKPKSSALNTGQIIDRAAPIGLVVEHQAATAQTLSEPRDLENRVLRGRTLTVVLRSGQRLEGCRLVSSDRYNWLFETVSDLATPTRSLVPKHAVDRIDVGGRIAA